MIISNFYIYYCICLKLLSLMTGHFSSGVHQKLSLIQRFGWKYFMLAVTQALWWALRKWCGVEAALGHQIYPQDWSIYSPMQWAVSGDCLYLQSCSLPGSSLYPGTGWRKGVYVPPPTFLTPQKSEWSCQLHSYLWGHWHPCCNYLLFNFSLCSSCSLLFPCRG